MRRRCVPLAADHGQQSRSTTPLLLILDRHDPAPLTEAFMRALSAVQEVMPARIDRAKALCVLYVRRNQVEGGRGEEGDPQ